MVKCLPHRLKTFGDRLTLDDVVAENETTQVGVGVGFDRANNKPESLSRDVDIDK